MYRELNDYELLYLVCDNDDDFNILVHKYEPLLKKIVNKYKNITKKYGYEYDDLYQICLYTLYRTSQSFDEKENNMFFTYLVRALNNSLINIIKENNNNKKKVLNESISYDNEIPNTELTYLDILPDIKIKPFDKQIQYNYKYIDFKNSLSFDKACIFELYYEGYTNKEIVKLLSISINELNDVISKIKKQLYYVKTS